MQKITTLLGEIKILDARTTYNKLIVQIDFDGTKESLTIYPKNKELISQLQNISTAYKRSLFVVANFRNEIETKIDAILLSEV